jgi:hypothetical protein
MGTLSRMHDVYDMSESTFHRFDHHHGIPRFPVTVRLPDKGGDIPEDLRVREFPASAVRA